jgi:hypothetical protein
MLIQTLSKRVFWGPVTTIPDADDYPKMTTTLRSIAMQVLCQSFVALTRQKR